MKKTYMIPEMMVVRLKTVGMVAATTLQTQNQDATTNSDGDYDDSRGMRQHSVWDED